MGNTPQATSGPQQSAPATSAPTAPGAAPYTFKVLLVGDCSVGKTHLVTCLGDGRATSQAYEPTRGTEIKYVKVNSKGSTYQLEINDTSGSSTYKEVNSVYYKRVDAIVMVYNVASKPTWESIKSNWWFQVKEKNPTAVHLIIANHQDSYLKDIADADAKNWCSREGVLWTGTSALEATGVKEAFDLLIENLLKQDKGKKDSNPSFMLNQNQPPPPTSGGCTIL